jgi:hypothetical protein
LTLFLQEILAMVEQFSTENRKPGMSLWIQLVGEMHGSASMDPSLWRCIRSALYTILNLYPQNGIGRKLLYIGLEAGVVAEDPNLAAAVLRNFSNAHAAEDTQEDISNDIPFQAVRAAMETCLKVSDAVSAELIIESIQNLGNIYPTGILKELYSLLLLCHAKSGQADEALSDLASMTEQLMEPG